MPKLPRTPPSVEAIRRSEPAWATLPAGTLLWRIFPRGGPYPTAWNRFRTWGPAHCRFDHHRPGHPPGTSHDRAILYLGSGFVTCIAEYFQDRRVVNRQRDLVSVVAFATTRPLVLLNLWDGWSTRVGCSGAISTGPHEVTRAWSRAFYEAFPAADGLRYESSMHPGEAAFACYERAADALPATPRFHRALADPDLLVPVVNAARYLGYSLL